MCIEVCVNTELLRKEENRIAKLEKIEEKFMGELEELDVWSRLDYIKDDYDAVAKKFSETRSFLEFLKEEW